MEADITQTSSQSAGRSFVGTASTIALLGGTQALILLAGLARWKVLAVGTGPVGVGAAGIIDQTAQIVLQIGALNIPTIALRFLAIERQTRGDAGFAWLYQTLLTVLLCATGLAGLVTALFFFVAPFASRSAIGAYMPALMWGLAAVPATAASNLIRSALATIRSHAPAATILAIGSASMAVAVYGGLRIGGLSGAYAAALITGTLTAITLHDAIRRRMPLGSRSRDPAILTLFSAHPDFTRFSIVLYAVGFAVPLTYGVVRWRVAGTLGLVEAGYLAAAYTVSSGVRAVFSQATTQHLMPLASRDDISPHAAAEAERYVRVLVLLIAAVVLPIALFSREALLILFSRKFIAVASVLGLFVLAEAILAISDVYRVLYLGVQDLSGYLIITAASVATVGVGTWWAVPRFGLLGLGILQVSSAVLVLALCIDRLRARHDTRTHRRTLGMFGAFVGGAAGAIVLPTVVHLGGASAALLKCVTAITLFVALVSVLPRDERHGVLRVVRPRRN